MLPSITVIQATTIAVTVRKTHPDKRERWSFKIRATVKKIYMYSQVKCIYIYIDRTNKNHQDRYPTVKNKYKAGVWYSVNDKMKPVFTLYLQKTSIHSRLALSRLVE